MPTLHENVLSWASDIEPETLEQAKRTARMPFIEGHVALMPDAHFGLGATVGSVIATNGAIMPAAVGVDIGCGMIAAELPFDAGLLPDDLDKLLGHIEKVIPAGVGQGFEGSTARWERELQPLLDRAPEISDKQKKKAVRQMGTLGSGNHFVEVCLDERDRVWLVLHSGSRGIGNELAKVHIDGARGLMKKFFIELEDKDLAFLVEGTPEFEAYIHAMLWAQDYAAQNRNTMMENLLVQMRGFVGFDFEPSSVINCHHNFTEREHHHGKNVWVTRKGAIRAREGDLGVIPGSMGTRSYIVSGLGNEASFTSCSHGAGRRMSRNRARKELSLESFEQAMEGKTWLRGRAKALLDEHPASYKDVEQVMRDQEDLVEIQHTLQQILNYKGV